MINISAATDRKFLIDLLQPTEWDFKSFQLDDIFGKKPDLYERAERIKDDGATFVVDQIGQAFSDDKCDYYNNAFWVEKKLRKFDVRCAPDIFSFLVEFSIARPDYPDIPIVEGSVITVSRISARHDFDNLPERKRKSCLKKAKELIIAKKRRNPSMTEPQAWEAAVSSLLIRSRLKRYYFADTRAEKDQTLLAALLSLRDQDYVWHVEVNPIESHRGEPARGIVVRWHFFLDAEGNRRTAFIPEPAESCAYPDRAKDEFEQMQPHSYDALIPSLFGWLSIRYQGKDNLTRKVTDDFTLYYQVDGASLIKDIEKLNNY